MLKVASNKTDVLAVQAVRVARLGEARDSLSSPEEASEWPKLCKEGQNSEKAREKKRASPLVELESKQERASKKYGNLSPTEKESKRKESIATP